MAVENLERKILASAFFPRQERREGEGGERKEKEEGKEQGKKEGWERLLLRKGEGGGGRVDRLLNKRPYPFRNKGIARSI